MLSYAIRRILFMIPTFIGILIINFAVLRMQGPTLVEQMQASGGNQPGMASSGDRKVQGAAKNVENYIDRFRRSGIDLPALINLRGWYTKEDYNDWINKTIANGVYYKTPSKRNKLEKELWLSGPQGIPPLLAILADETLAKIHAPTAQALSYCGYVTLSPRDLQRMSGVEVQRIQQRNQTLRDNRIFFNNTREQGIEVVDDEAEKKRATLIALFTDPVNEAEYKARAGSAMGALFIQTGFCDFITKLFTGELYSESRKEYVFTVIEDRWSVTFWLNSIAILIAWVVSVPLGIRSARRMNSLEDRTTTTALFLAWSMPSMFYALIRLVEKPCFRIVVYQASTRCGCQPGYILAI